MEGQSTTKKTGRPTSWTPARKNQLKRLANNRKGVSQRRHDRKLGVSHVTICRQLSQMNISCYKCEKTPKYSEKQAEKAKNLCKKLANLLYRSSCCLIFDDETYFTGLMVQPCQETTTTTRMTSLNVQIVSALLEQNNGLGSHFQ